MKQEWSPWKSARWPAARGPKREVRTEGRIPSAVAENIPSWTGGGTRIIYDRKFLLECRNSPIARTPPCCLPQIPGVTVPLLHPVGKLQELKEELEEEVKDLPAEDNQFEMDI
ncbi:hypothetical protein Z043_105254 [Scleropages formosus]|uniref:Eukaryotic translation initiation factor 4E-binding protein 3-like n=1 Tax=Scleropages formosus TaxID=113540 RepID=A0A0P7UZ54_SCLFO|nr:hypothetical protein Z043_105254 [Scleropages formosus]